MAKTDDGFFEIRENEETAQWRENRVCIMIDFENLAFSLSGSHMADNLDVSLLFMMAEEYGKVILANAYADWRIKSLGQFQPDLYRLGAEPVQVVSKKGKNAVDVKMAIDAVELLWTSKEIDTFVVVSGDRDFIHLLKTLRRYGKTVVGIGPTSSTSEDFASLCDYFTYYSSLASTYPRAMRSAEENAPGGECAIEREVARDAEETEKLRSAMKRILSGFAQEGLKGSSIKPLLRQALSPAFHEKQYGFPRMQSLLLSMPDIVRVTYPDADGDLQVFPADKRAGGSNGSSTSLEGSLEKKELSVQSRELVRVSGINEYRYEADPRRRRGILRSIHDAMGRLKVFSWRELCREVLETAEEPNLSATLLSKYQAVFWQSRAFEILPGQEGPLKSRKIHLAPELLDFEAFCRHYETSIVFKVISKASTSVTRKEVSNLLGIPGDDRKNAAYCSFLLSEAERKLGVAAERARVLN